MSVLHSTSIIPSDTYILLYSIYLRDLKGVLKRHQILTRFLFQMVFFLEVVLQSFNLSRYKFFVLYNWFYINKVLTFLINCEFFQSVILSGVIEDYVILPLFSVPVVFYFFFVSILGFVVFIFETIKLSKRGLFIM